MKAFSITSSGDFAEQDLVRRDLVKEFKIHIRDLRPVFLIKQVSTLVRRGECIIVNLRSIKMLIGHKNLYIFNLSNSKNIKNFAELLTQRIKKKEQIKFEHIVLEFSLEYILEQIKRRFEDIERISDKILTNLNNLLHDEDFEKLLSLKKQLSKLGSNTKEINEMIEDILGDHEKIKELYLYQKNIFKTEELESILENFIEQIEDISNRIDELNENIDYTQEILTLKMSSRRNTIIKFDLLINSITAILAFLAVIVGFYGMNVKNYLEESGNASTMLGIILFVIFIFFGLGIFWYLKRKKIL